MSPLRYSQVPPWESWLIEKYFFLTIERILWSKSTLVIFSGLYFYKCSRLLIWTAIFFALALSRWLVYFDFSVQWSLLTTYWDIFKWTFDTWIQLWMFSMFNLSWRKKREETGLTWPWKIWFPIRFLLLGLFIKTALIPKQLIKYLCVILWYFKRLH